MHRVEWLALAGLFCLVPQGPSSAPATLQVQPPAAGPARHAEPSLEGALADVQSALAKLKQLRAAAGESNSVDVQKLAELGAASQALAGEIQSWGRALQPKPAASLAQPGAGARAKAKGWIEALHALGADAPARREETLAAVRAGLESGDEEGQLAALLTLQSSGDVEFDKAPFRALILPHAQTAKGPRLHAALYALRNTAWEPADLALVHDGWKRDPDALRSSVLHLMTMFGGGKLEGRSEEVALEALADCEQGTRSAGINGLWGARVGPKLEARVLALEQSTDSDVRHDAIYFGLSTFADKSPAVVEALIRILTDPDFNNSDRALWGLGQGVPTELQPRVVDALVDLHNGRSSPAVRETCRRLVQRYGGASALERLAK